MCPLLALGLRERKPQCHCWPPPPQSPLLHLPLLTALSPPVSAKTHPTVPHTAPPPHGAPFFPCFFFFFSAYSFILLSLKQVTVARRQAAAEVRSGRGYSLSVCLLLGKHFPPLKLLSKELKERRKHNFWGQRAGQRAASEAQGKMVCLLYSEGSETGGSWWWRGGL